MFTFGASVVSPMICVCPWFSIMIVYTCFSCAVVVAPSPPESPAPPSLAGVAPSPVGAPSEVVPSADASEGALGTGVLLSSPLPQAKSAADAANAEPAKRVTRPMQSHGKASHRTFR